VLDANARCRAAAPPRKKKTFFDFSVAKRTVSTSL